MFKALTIAGSDTSGGAGIQADLKTFQELEVYGMTALTIIVAQNPFNNWAHDIFPIDLKTIEAQIDTVLKGINIDALKTGMLPNEDVIKLVAKKIKDYNIKNVVIDPVMVCKGTNDIVNNLAVETFKKDLIPLSDIVTPNIFEAFYLSGIEIKDLESFKKAAEVIYNLGTKSVFIKGGSKFDDKKAIDLFYDGKDFKFLESNIIDHSYNHGAGCTTAAAITAFLAKGYSIEDSVLNAKKFITNAINDGFKLNEYVGAVKPSANRKEIF